MGIAATGWCGSQKTRLSPEGQFQELYNQYTKAYLGKDATSLQRLLAPDFHTGSLSHPVDKKLLIDGAMHPSNSLRTNYRKVLQVVINKDKASVMVHQISIGLSTDPKTHKNHEFRLELDCADSWVKNSGQWQIHRMKTLRAKATQDGKPFKGRIIT
jgi:hypothetical protein